MRLVLVTDGVLCGSELYFLVVVVIVCGGAWYWGWWSLSNSGW